MKNDDYFEKWLVSEDKRFDAMMLRIDNLMKFSIFMTFVASGLVITILQYLNHPIS